MVFATNSTAINNSKLLTTPIKSLGLRAVIVAALFYILSAIGHFYPASAGILTIIIGAGALICSMIQPRWGLILVIIELVIGSQGHLLEMSLAGVTISLRQILFVALLIGWLYSRYRSQEKVISIPSPWRAPYYALWLMIIINMITGLARYGWSAMFFDANGYWYLLLAPIIFDLVKPSDWSWVGKVVTGGQVVLIFLTVGLVMMFAWQPWDITSIYKWVRDIRIAEITHVVGSYFRVFFQSQLYSLFLALGALAAWLNGGVWKKSSTIIITILSSLTVVASLSRSFWAGALGGLILLFIILRCQQQWPWLKMARLGGLIIATLVAEVVFLQVITGNFPSPAFNDRLTKFVEPASISRAAQLKPLWQAVVQHPILGSGFGRQVSYITADPRRVQDNVVVSTSAFELGWLDSWLDIGLIGIVALGWWLWRLLSTSIRLIGRTSADSVAAPIDMNYNNRTSKWGWRGATLTSGAVITAIIIISLIITHAFSPYLNHPLGLFAVMLLAALAPRLNSPA